MSAGKCFVCKEELSLAYQGDPNQHNATAFYASGNYGSGLFDPLDGSLQLKINICDGCLVGNRAEVSQVTEHQELPTYTYTSWELE